ncbi:MAG: hypothetical protein K940chlam7_00805 [Chlamydiae bacterium]|nr:hypothetical protein [Chlamydiota bacterium]
MSSPKRIDTPSNASKISLTFGVSEDKEIIVDNGLIRLPDGTAYKVTLRNSEGTKKTIDPSKELSKKEKQLLKKVVKMLMKAQEEKEVAFKNLSKTEITSEGIVSDQFPKTYNASEYKHKFKRISDVGAKILQTTQPTPAPATESKVRKAIRKSKVFGDFEEFARGKDKAVLRRIKRDSIPSSDLEQPEKAYYIPIVNFPLRKNALRKEKEKMDLIKESLSNDAKTHLAVEAVESHEKIRGRYTLEVEKAEANFEQVIQSTETSFEQRKIFGRHLLEGLVALHKVGWAYGDLKPENLLIYGKGKKEILKIADFGKAKKVGSETKKYTGNLRFSPPEGKLSKKGDVWGAALVLIRTLEEAVLTDKEPLVAVTGKKIDQPSDKRRGIERFIIQHKAFLGVEITTLIERIYKGLPRRAKLGKLSSKKRQLQAELIHKYIDKLTKKLVGKGVIGAGQQETDLKNLLMEMTKESPKKRISIDDALTKYNQIFPPPTSP